MNDERFKEQSCDLPEGNSVPRHRRYLRVASPCAEFHRPNSDSHRARNLELLPRLLLRLLRHRTLRRCAFPFRRPIRICEISAETARLLTHHWSALTVPWDV